MTIIKTNIVAILAGLLLLGALFVQYAGIAEAVFPNMQPRAQTATTTATGPDTVKTLFSATDNCASRIITTRASDVLLSFKSDMTPSGSVGHEQLASTTVTYDAEQFGCGAVMVYGRASSTLTTTQFIF